MRVMVLGSGAREHALVWKIAQSPLVSRLYCAPGNPGTLRWAQNVPVATEDAADVLRVCREHGIELVVIGPEAPLVAGVADALEREGIAVFGPSRAAARLEGSKHFAKEVMLKAGVPTAQFESFTSVSAAEAYARSKGRIVIKADGLAAGKGVVVAHSVDEAMQGLKQVARLGSASQTLVLEELLEGEEVSVIALCDGKRFVLMPPARDHKRLRDGDRGPNTGGMGAYSPVPFVSAEQLREIGRTVIAPTLAEMAARGAPFRGALYAGLMLTNAGPKVLEYNCRFGDPETQVLMLACDDDLLSVMYECARGELKTTSLSTSGGYAVGVVLAAEGYPESPKKGSVIEGLDAVASDVHVFHAGTRLENGRLVANGGRVLTVCVRRASADLAIRDAYSAVDALHFAGMQFRRDIARGAVIT